MVFKAILLCVYLGLKAALGITAAIDPSFKRRLRERDLSFAVSSRKAKVAGLFELRGGKLTFHSRIDRPLNFSAEWTGWGQADTLSKKLHLNIMALLNTGMIGVAGDISALDYLLVLLGEMLGTYKRRLGKAAA